MRLEVIVGLNSEERPCVAEVARGLFVGSLVLLCKERRPLNGLLSNSEDGVLLYDGRRVELDGSR